MEINKPLRITDDDVYVDRIDSVFGRWISAYNLIRSSQDALLRENDYRDYESDRCNRKIGKVREVFLRMAHEVELLLPDKIAQFIERCKGVSQIDVYMDAKGRLLKWHESHEHGCVKRVQMVCDEKSMRPEFEIAEGS